MEEFLGPHPDYDEEEEERKYYRRKRLGVVKNVVGASCGGMIIYSVYMGQPLRNTPQAHNMIQSSNDLILLKVCARCFIKRSYCKYDIE